MKPRIFISAVTKELRSARQLVANTLVALGYEPVWQDIFDTSGEDIRSMLRKKIDTCSAVLQIVGDAYGAEPPTHDENFGRVSYTQYEALYARSIGKKVYYLIASNDLHRDTSPDLLDPAMDDSDAARVDSQQRRQLQRDYRASVQATGHIYYAIQSQPETELAVRRLKDELDKLRRGFRNWMIGVSVGLVVIVIGIAWLSGGVQNLLTLISEGQKKTAEQIVDSGKKTAEELKGVIETAVKELTNPSVLAERIRKEIKTTSEAKISVLPDQPGRGRLIAEIEKERDLALGRVEDLIKLIQEGLKEGASPVFQRAADILQKEGTDEALAYLESRRESTLDDARRHADQANASEAKAKAEKELRNRSLQPLILEAELLESKLQWDAARKLREQIAELAPDWFQTRNRLGMLYLNLAQFQKAEPHLRAALKLADTPTDGATALNSLARLLQATNRPAEAEPLMRRALAIDEQSYGAENPKVALNLNNLATLLLDTNRLAEAEPLFHRALAIDEQSYGAEHPNVARDLNNLATLLLDTNRLAEAEPLMRRALAIDEQSYGAEHPDVARHLNNLAQLLQATSRLAEAEPLMRRALAIDERSYGAEHPNVAIKLNNLAQLLQATNCLAEAEPLYRRALAIDVQSYGAEHPSVAIRLNNLAQLLQVTNRLAEAEPLMRRALAIDEQSYGAEHPLVGLQLWSLASLLQDTTRLNDAVPLLRRAISNFHQFGEKSGHELPYWKSALDQYRLMLQASKYPPDEIAQLINTATTTTGPLTAIAPDVELRFGPAKPVAEVLAALDRQYKADGKPEVYFLKPDQPIASHLDELLKPNPDSLTAAGVNAYREGDHAEAIAYYEESLKLLAGKPDDLATAFTNRMNRAAALRDLGEVIQARDELRKLVSNLREGDMISALSKGLARNHLALCEWRLNDLEAAKHEAEESLKEYGDDQESVAVKKQTEQLLADLKENKPLPPLTKLADGSTVAEALERARNRLRARSDLATLPLKQSALPLLDQLLGPAKSTKEIFDTLDQQYRKQSKPAIWFLPLSEPISPHLDQLLGPIDSTRRAS